MRSRSATFLWTFTSLHLFLKDAFLKDLRFLRKWITRRTNVFRSMRCFKPTFVYSLARFYLWAGRVEVSVSCRSGEALDFSERLFALIANYSATRTLPARTNKRAIACIALPAWRKLEAQLQPTPCTARRVGRGRIPYIRGFVPVHREKELMRTRGQPIYQDTLSSFAKSVDDLVEYINKLHHQNTKSQKFWKSYHFLTWF